MARLVGISGSLRRGSFNTALLNAAAEAAPSGVAFEIASIAGIPLYDGDVEAEGIPAPVAALKDTIAAADGVLLVTPEYNGSVPGVFKNAVDWTTRPSADMARVWGDRPVGVIGTSPGGFGSVLSQNAWLPVIRKLGALQWHGATLMVSHARTVFDADGRLVDDKVREGLRQYLAGFAAFVGRHRREG
jgi:NAD(P)H-dependent FMN reductase